MDKFIGKRLDGRYEIREIIGVGGMAYVYKAYDTIDDRIVAVKILKEEYLANEEFTRRFKNESKAIAILSHPNIVKVYDVSFGERLQYIVMEYIDGITLKEYIDQQKDIKWKEAVHFTVQILRALQHAHDKGIVHRDIKPQNIMLLADGTIKVTDFGIALFSRKEIRLTSETEKAIGSVHYISPEQARGDITDEKADIYSVGVMLYEMLSGKLPFEADNAVSVAIMQLQSEPKRPREINPDIPEGLEEITLKAMQKDPEKRYQTAAEMLYDIDEFKRNPSIHFEYTYFVDETPTRFVEAITRVKGAEEPEQSEEEEPEEEEEEKKGPPVLPILAAITGAFVLVCLIFVGIVTLMGIINPDGDEADERLTIPNLIDALYKEEEFKAAYPEIVEGLKVVVRSEYNEITEADHIISTDPPAGSKISKGRTFIIVVSKGKRLVQIPEVQENENKDVYISRLRNAGLEVVERPMNSDTVEKDCVVMTSPAYPDEVAHGSKITVFYSNGTDKIEPDQVPNVTQMSQESATQTLNGKGFIVGEITYENHDSLAKGMVIRQSPEADTPLDAGEPVNLVLSSGYKDAKNVMLVLPKTNTTINLQVFINGKLQDSSRPEYSTDLQGLLPNAIPNHTMFFNFTEQQEQYTVTFMIAAAGGTYAPFAEFSINGLSGTATQTASHEFKDPNAVQTTTSSRIPTTTKPEPTEPEPTYDVIVTAAEPTEPESIGTAANGAD